MIIEIILKSDDEEVIEKSEAYSFESAEESLGKMRRRYEAMLDKQDAMADLEADQAREDEYGR